MFGQQFHKRTNESPMDFEWQTHAPIDPNSPFPQFKPQPGSFESPAKTSFANPAIPPAPQFRNPSFTTPRKPFDQELFSEVSGCESSPADNTDADAEDTPERKSITKAMGNVAVSSAGKSLFKRYGTEFTGNSPSRADQRRGKFGNALLYKARKRKRIDRDNALITRTGSDSESESEERMKEKNLYPTKSWFGNLLDGIDSRPNLPNVLSYYAQLLMNSTLVFAFIYFLYCSWQVVSGDVNKASSVVKSEVMAEMAQCAKDYTLNGCHREDRAPALETVCNSWELCMNKDPDASSRAKISARTFAEIFNSFVEPISWKAMIFVVLLLAVSIMVNNLAFNMFRSKSPSNIHMPHMPHVPQYFSHQPPWGQGQIGEVPQTPSHNHGGYDAFGTTYQQIMPSATSMRNRSPSKESRSPSKGNRSPSKGNRIPSKEERDRDLVMYD
ncbi:Di-sulfide bridge nucleocytoplasmic transport domain-containing protein [Bisporella sp. PMI_857]|nr:Di-sulfide bridge nucleocytoplasmic transport domain-containing protein [Bisporella sp. PMI_857]